MSDVGKEQSAGPPVAHEQGGGPRFSVPEHVLEGNRDQSAHGTIGEHLDRCSSASFFVVLLLECMHLGKRSEVMSVNGLNCYLNVWLSSWFVCYLELFLDIRFVLENDASHFSHESANTEETTQASSGVFSLYPCADAPYHTLVSRLDER